MAPTKYLMGTTLATNGITRVTRKGRPNYPVDFKRHLAALACEPGTSVAKVALEHAINVSRGTQISTVVGFENSPPGSRFGLVRADEAGLFGRAQSEHVAAATPGGSMMPNAPLPPGDRLQPVHG